PAGGEAAERVRGPGWWMGTPIHPDHPMAFGDLRPPVDRHQPLRVRITLLPRAEVAGRAHLVRRHVSITLMMAQRHTRWIVGERPQTSGFVQREAAVIV